MRSWDELTELERLASEYSDAYKDCHGFRPRFTDNWTEDDYRKALDRLYEVWERKRAEDEADEAIAISKFEANVQKLIGMGAKDRATAIRWLLDGADVQDDPRLLETVSGLPYGYLRQPTAA